MAVPFGPVIVAVAAIRRRYTMSMQVFTARVRDGAIVPEDDVKLPEGTRVTVVAGGPEQEVELSASEEEELLESIREAERGEVVTAEDLLRRLAR
jgi:predicted DNA-binding antitoxin AbrB/MazE fold protein